MFKHSPYNKFKSDAYRFAALAWRSLCQTAAAIVCAVYGTPEVVQWLRHL